MPPEGAPRRRSRIGLYGPVLALLLLAVGWSVLWVVIREQTRKGFDEWIAAEAAVGRLWSCADRSIGGYPFRMELRCSEFSVSRPDVHATIGQLHVVTQLYQPGHVIAEASGPLRIEAGGIRADGNWQLLQASVIVSTSGLDRVSIVADGPAVTIDGAGPAAFDLASRRFEAHLRPDTAERGAYDLALRSDGAVIPGLDSIVGGTEPADFVLTLNINQTDDLPARPLWSELERWRVAGGRLSLSKLDMTKGPRRAEARGVLRIDAQHRPEGQLDMAAAGLGGLLGRMASGAGLGGALIGTFFGAPEPPPAPKGTVPPLRPLPPLRLQDGRVYVGPLPLPGLRVPPLY